jgi:hypothetical protein
MIAKNLSRRLDRLEGRLTPATPGCCRSSSRVLMDRTEPSNLS